MASDWIKVRTDIYRDPKVIRMADLLMDEHSDLSAYVDQNMQCRMSVTRNVTRNAVVGAMVSIWGIARRQGSRVHDDLRLSDASIYTLDDIGDLQGIGAAMAAVGWVQEDIDGLLFPMFFREYNSEIDCASKSKNAERQKRYRDAKRNVTSNVTSNVTLQTEKRREEKNIETQTQDTFASMVPQSEQPTKQKAERTTFQRPTTTDVIAYVKEIGATIDGKEFCDFYASNGWKVGRNAMKDWKATVRQWEARRKAKAAENTNGHHDSPEWLLVIDTFHKHPGDTMQDREARGKAWSKEICSALRAAGGIGRLSGNSFERKELKADFERNLKAGQR